MTKNIVISTPYLYQRRYLFTGDQFPKVFEMHKWNYQSKKDYLYWYHAAQEHYTHKKHFDRGWLFYSDPTELLNYINKEI